MITMKKMKSDGFFQNIFETGPLGMIITDMQQQIIKINMAIHALVGYTEPELIGRTLSEITHPEDVGLGLKSIGQLQIGESIAAKFETRYVRNDKSWLWAAVTISLIFEEQDNPLHFLVMVEDITKRKQAELCLQTSLQEKELLLQEIHHRTKNNLQIISGLLYQQTKRVKDVPTLDVLKEGQSRVKSMALIHEKFNSSQNLNQIDFTSYIRHLINHIYQAYGITPSEVALNFNFDNIFLDINTAIPCGLIINELISNALKYAFLPYPPHSAQITLNMHEGDDGQIGLSISDNGVGLFEDIDFRQTNTTGLGLVNNLVKQLEGTIALYSQHGTRFVITFVKPKSK